MTTSACPGCASTLALEDNFCRRCGVPVVDTRLPTVRPEMSAVVWRPRVPRIVQGAAVMAAGTVGQYVVRRVLSNMLTGVRRGPGRSIRRPANDGLMDEAQIITETVMMRRVRIRRQA